MTDINAQYAGFNPESRRYYWAYLQQDLFGNWAVMAGWGSQETRQGRQKSFPCGSYEQALKRLAAMEKRRGKRGYQPYPDMRHK